MRNGKCLHGRVSTCRADQIADSGNITRFKLRGNRDGDYPDTNYRQGPNCRSSRCSLTHRHSRDLESGASRVTKRQPTTECPNDCLTSGFRAPMTAANRTSHDVRRRDVTLIGGESLRFACFGSDWPSAQDSGRGSSGPFSIVSTSDAVRQSPSSLDQTGQSNQSVSSSISRTLSPTRTGP
jgi:hypothetical protein